MTNPFALIDKLSAGMAPQEIKETAGVDQARVKRDAARREKADGPLRARERPRCRPRRGRPVLGRMEEPTA